MGLDERGGSMGGNMVGRLDSAIKELELLKAEAKEQNFYNLHDSLSDALKELYWSYYVLLEGDSEAFESL